MLINGKEKELDVLIDEAIKARACDNEITIIQELSEEEFISHSRRIYWEYWYWLHVMTDPWYELEDLMFATYPKTQFLYYYMDVRHNDRWERFENYLVNNDLDEGEYLHYIRKKYGLCKEMDAITNIRKFRELRNSSLK